MIFGKGERRRTIRTSSENLTKSAEIAAFWRVLTQSPAANGKRLFSYFSSASFAVFKNPNTLSIALWQAVN